MSQTQHIINEFEHEMKTTQRFFDALTEELLRYRPHEKSMDGKQLANHLLNLPRLVPFIVEKEAVDWATDKFPPDATTVAGMQKAFGESVALAKEAFTKLREDTLTETWSMKNGEAVYMTVPKRIALRHLILNHMIHHRAQLGVYFRMNDISVPASYGRSADEVPEQ